jgi:nitrite reductase/ring-hydroxylating ferredoxin subunit
VRLVLCHLDELADPGARGFTFGEGTGRREVFVVRRGAEVFAYVNSCPHQGTPLDFLPDRFLTRNGQEILCSTHGARFEIATGKCVLGPCEGLSLRRVAIAVEDGAVSTEAPWAA